MRMISLQSLALAAGLAMLGCSGSSSKEGGAAQGGTSSTAGATSAGGATSTGGTSSTGGTTSTGGAGTGGVAGGSGGAAGGSPTGGSEATAGNAAGGAATGGNETGGAGGGGSGGRQATGGKATDGGPGGGATGSGGAPGSGGRSGSDGRSSDGANGTSDAGAAVTETIPGNGCTPPAAYANLFVSVSGHTQADTDAKITAAWNQLFNPSNSNTIYYDGPGSDESYVKDIGNGDVRSEGMSYGMMIAVQLGKQTEFDRLWTWVKKHMANGTGQICWQNRTDGSKMSGGGAPDGEEYFATALIFASKRWGDSGKYNYANEAKWILNLIRTTYFNSTYHIVRFVSGSGNTDASYILPAFYQVWACFDTANAAYWNEAVKAGRDFFHNAIDGNGVIGDQSSFTGQTVKAAGPDTIRCVANIMMDHNFFDADSWQTETYAPKYGSYVTSHNQNSTAATSCNGLLGFGLPASSGKALVDKVWSLAIPTGTWRYYDGCWYLMALLHMSGTFHLWY
jgi:oligosaccharide reducing-end xylanase